jgi:cytochrome P450
MSDRGMSDDQLDDHLEFFQNHFNPWHPTFTEHMWEAVPEMLDTCPVFHSDAFGGFWVLSTYEDVTGGYRNFRQFSSALEKSLPPLRPGQPSKPPVDLDAPDHRRYRQVLNPFLTPERIAGFEPWIRGLVTELIDGFVEDGHCDLAGQFSRQLPGRMLFRLLFGIDDAQMPMVQAWVHKVAYEPTAPETLQAERDWIDWMLAIVDERRRGPRQDDIIDALIHTEIDGELLDDETIMATMYILILGGFGTTADGISSIMMNLALRPELQVRLRDDPEQLPEAIEELLRFDPPIAGQSRICVEATSVGGHEIKPGERIFLWLAAANHDPAEFDQPDQIDLDRGMNPHIVFGVGPHRCIGSNVARLNLRIMLEELLARVRDFRLTPGDSVRRRPSSAWGPSYLPLTFTPGPRSSESVTGPRRTPRRAP